jgi:hypothetical protein
MHVNGIAHTKQGSLSYAITSATHVSIQQGATWLYRGKHIQFHLHLHLIGGVWQRKRDEHMYFHDNVSWKGKEIVEAEVTAGWAAYIVQHPELLVEAAGNHFEEEELELAVEMVNAERALNKARQALYDLRRFHKHPHYECPEDNDQLAGDIKPHEWAPELADKIRCDYRVKKD